MNKWPVEKIQRVATPLIVAVTVGAATIASLVGIKRDAARRHRRAVFFALIGGLVLLGVVAAIVEFAVDSTPDPQPALRSVPF